MYLKIKVYILELFLSKLLMGKVILVVYMYFVNVSKTKVTISSADSATVLRLWAICRRGCGW